MRHAQLTSQVVQSSPPARIFTLIGQVTASPIIASTKIPTLVLDPMTEEISLTSICVMTSIGFNQWMNPTKKAEELLTMLTGTEVDWSVIPVLRSAFFIIFRQYL
jgi:hypothetical protein